MGVGVCKAHHVWNGFLVVNTWASSLLLIVIDIYPLHDMEKEKNACRGKQCV